MDNGQQVFIVLGPPGAGKGTQAHLLEEKFGVSHLETSDLIEQAFASGRKEVEFEGRTYSLKKQEELYEKGELCNSLFAAALIQARVKELREKGEGVVFSASPRTITEGKRLMPFLDRLFGREEITVFFLEVPVEEAVFRNSHRRICALARHSILWHEQTEDLTICPLDGSKLRKRELDKPEMIRQRYEVFERKTIPLLSWLEEEGYDFKRIDGTPSVAEVHKTIMGEIQ